MARTQKYRTHGAKCPANGARRGGTVRLVDHALRRGYFIWPADRLLEVLLRDARNLDKAGVPRRVAMELMGRKTESIYSRYRIVDDGEKRVALQRVQEYLRHAGESAEQAARTSTTVVQ